MAPVLYDIALEAARSFLLGYDISYQIALYIHSNFRSQQAAKIKCVLGFNLDKQRLEAEMRTFFIIRQLGS